MTADTDIVDKHDNPWVQIEQLQMEIERLTECLKIRTSECRNLAAKINSEVLAERESCAVLLESEANRIKHTSHRDGLGMGHQAIEQALVYQAAAIRRGQT